MICVASAQDELAWSSAWLAGRVERPGLRIWHHPQACVVLGRQQWRRWPSPMDRKDGWDCQVLLRPSGGTAVLAGPWMLSVAVVLPVQHRLAGTKLADAYRWLGLVLAWWLRRHGIDAEVQRLGRVAPPGLDWACFAGVSPWEICVRGRKIVGLAQARRLQGILLNAGLLLEPVPWEILCRVLDQDGRHAAALDACVTSCAQEAHAGFDANRWAHELHGWLQRWIDA